MLKIRKNLLIFIALIAPISNCFSCENLLEDELVHSLCMHILKTNKSVSAKELDKNEQYISSDKYVAMITDKDVSKNPKIDNGRFVIYIGAKQSKNNKLYIVDIPIDIIQVYNSKIKFDFAPYRYNNTKNLMGLRHQNTYSRPGLLHTYEDLYLFKSTLNKLEFVATIRTQHSSYDGDEVHVDEESIVVISKKQTNGVFDLKIKTRTLDAEGKKSNYVVSSTLKWNGQKYE